MLIRFRVSNFRSFDQEVVFSLLPGAAQKHQDHIVANPESQIDVLRFAMLYGANASGKSNLVRALAFAQDFIVDGTRPKASIAVEPFRLTLAKTKQPSHFEFEFMVGTKAYAYGFVVDRRNVREEWLYRVNQQDEHAVFERKIGKQKQIETNFSGLLNSDQQFLQFVARGTRPNELLLTKLAENNVKEFTAIYEWFQRKLTIIFPNSRDSNIEVNIYKDHKFGQALAAFLTAMNTGINEVHTRAVDVDTIDIPLDLVRSKLAIGSSPPENGKEPSEQLIVLNTPKGIYLLQRDEEDDFVAHALSTRRKVGGESVDFELIDESDGTRRLLDLFPILYSVEDRVFIIDELERSLHPNLVQNFIKYFLFSDR